MRGCRKQVNKRLRGCSATFTHRKVTNRTPGRACTCGTSHQRGFGLPRAPYQPSTTVFPSENRPRSPGAPSELRETENPQLGTFGRSNTGSLGIDCICMVFECF